jgi:drug/metabolite transporter (DMT)-like permease
LRVTEEGPRSAPPPREGSVFRAVLGYLAVVGGLAGLAGLYFVTVPEGNKEPLLLAIGLVLGWGSSVINSEYGASTTGRQLAQVTIDKAKQDAQP